MATSWPKLRRNFTGFYAWLARKASDAEVRREELTEEVKEIHAEAKGRYGSPRIHAELVGRGHECGVNVVAKVMQEAGIAAKTKRKFRQTTDSNHTLPVAENVLDRDFNPEVPNATWVPLRSARPYRIARAAVAGRPAR